MAFGGLHQQSGGQQPMAEINMIPLIDVMLVLLVIFIITAPLLSRAIQLDLPQAAAAPAASRPDTIHVSLDSAGRIYWNREAVDTLRWQKQLQGAAGQNPQPEVHLHADGDLDYRQVASVMSDISQSGLQRLSFVMSQKGDREEDVVK